MSPPSMLFLLLAGHALADFPLQGQFLAEAKNRHTPIGRLLWPWALPGHALIHGAVVLLVTGSMTLGMAEAAAHVVTDWFRCEERISFNFDQAIHVALKVLWVAIVTTV